MSNTKVSSRGQTVIPRDIRIRYGIRTGTRMEWLSRDADTILVRKIATKRSQTDWGAWAKAWKGLGAELWKGVDPVEHTHRVWHD